MLKIDSRDVTSLTYILAMRDRRADESRRTIRPMDGIPLKSYATCELQGKESLELR